MALAIAPAIKPKAIHARMFMIFNLVNIFTDSHRLTIPSLALNLSSELIIESDNKLFL
jgi:hypothetical protein